MKWKNKIVKKKLLFEVIVSLCHCMLVTSNTQVFYMLYITNWKISNILIFTHVILLIGMACFSCVMQPFQQYVFLIFCKYLFICFFWQVLFVFEQRCFQTCLPATARHSDARNRQAIDWQTGTNISGFAYWQLEWREQQREPCLAAVQTPRARAGERAEPTWLPRSIQRLISALAALNLRWEVDLWMQKWPQLVKKPDHLGEMWVYCVRASLLQIANRGCGRTDQGALPLWINSSPPSC